MALADCDHVNQLFMHMQNEKYVPSQEEFEAISRCKKRMKSNLVQAFTAIGSLVWSVSGRLQLMPRLIATFAGASMGAFASGGWSAQYCTDEFLALDGSHLQEKIVAIMQNEALFKPRIRATLEKYYYIEPVYDDLGQTTPRIALRKREVPGFRSEMPGREANTFGRDQDIIENPKELSMPSPMEQKENKHDEPFEDPFKVLFSIDTEESSKVASDSWKNRSKMRVLERREFNRVRYLKWKERQSLGEWTEAQKAEL